MTLRKLFRSAETNRRKNRRRRLHLEQCEARNLLAVFTVTSELDNGAVGELRWAVNQANSLAGADEVRFAAGVTNISLTQGEIPITDAVSINIPSVAPDLITINAASNSRIFRINDGTFSDINVEMAALHLRGGDVSLAGVSQGGAVLNDEHLTIRNGLVSESVANVGGGIANRGELTMVGSRLSENESLGTGGGGLWNGPQSVATIAGGTIDGNQATGGSGGGILNDVGALLTIDGGAQVVANFAASEGGGMLLASGSFANLLQTVVQSNAANTGGGVMVDQATLTTSPLTEVLGNQARRGAGIAVTEFGQATVHNSLISGNAASLEGGGMLVDGFGSATFLGGEVTANQAGSMLPADGRGGGLFIGDGEVTMNNTIVNYNGASAVLTSLEKGGGAFLAGNARLDATDATFSGNVASVGGAVYAASSSNTPSYLTMTGSSVRNNFVYESGGGIFGGANAQIELLDSTITNNEALTGRGGGISLQGGILGTPGSAGPSASVRDSTISINRATVGAGISSFGQAALLLDGVNVVENSARQTGGGIALEGSNPTTGIASSVIFNSRILDNIAADPAGADPRNGGGVWVGPNTESGISTTTIAGNTASDWGGGLYVSTNRGFRLADSTVSGNVADRGAGAAFLNSSASVQQNTFYANRATYDGGGLYVRKTVVDDTEIVNLEHNTFSLNSAALSGIGRGGAIWVGADNAAIAGVVVRLNHTIVSGNLGAPLGGFDEVFDLGAYSPVGSPHVIASYSLLRDNVGTLLAPGNPDPAGNLIGSAASPIDALLGPLTSAGGPTLTMVPSDNSPAIDAGDPAFSGPPFSDQRQAPFVRAFSDRIDMGAVEVQTLPPTPDFDGDGDADCHDVNALTTVIADETNLPQFDLTGDGVVDLDDLEQWLDDAPDVNGIGVDAYLPADATLDLSVDAEDFIEWNIHKFTENSNFCDGDFNADGFVDGLDFIIWNMYKFQASAAPPNIVAGTPTINASQRQAVDSVMANFAAPIRDSSRMPPVYKNTATSVSQISVTEGEDTERHDWLDKPWTM